MSRRFASILVIGAAAAACSGPSIADRQPVPPRQGQIRKIADGCGLPAGALRQDESGRLRFRPAPDTRYEVVDCVLVQLREQGLADHMPMAFVGNETPSEEAGNDAPPH